MGRQVGRFCVSDPGCRPDRPRADVFGEATGKLGLPGAARLRYFTQQLDSLINLSALLGSPRLFTQRLRLDSLMQVTCESGIGIHSAATLGSDASPVVPLETRASTPAADCGPEVSNPGRRHHDGAGASESPVFRRRSSVRNANLDSGCAYDFLSASTLRP